MSRDDTNIFVTVVDDDKKDRKIPARTIVTNNQTLNSDGYPDAFNLPNESPTSVIDRNNNIDSATLLDQPGTTVPNFDFPTTSKTNNNNTIIQIETEVVILPSNVPPNSIIVGSNTPNDKVPQNTLTKEYRVYFGKHYSRYVVKTKEELNIILDKFMNHVGVTSLSFLIEVRKAKDDDGDDGVKRKKKKNSGLLKGYKVLESDDLFSVVALDIQNRKKFVIDTVKDFHEYATIQREKLKNIKYIAHTVEYSSYLTTLANFEENIKNCASLDPHDEKEMIAGYVKVLDSHWDNTIIVSSKRLSPTENASKSNKNKKHKTIILPSPNCSSDNDNRDCCDIQENDVPHREVKNSTIETSVCNFEDSKEIGDINDNACAIYAFNGDLHNLQLSHERGCPWDEKTSGNAVCNGHLNCLQYAHENGCPWDKETCCNAAYYGHLNCLKYAHENGCPWDEITCSNAAYSGHLNCLKYAHEKGCPWDEITCSNAAYSGHLSCLQYAHKEGCPWDEWTCSDAACNGYLNCLQYAHEKECPWDEKTCSNAACNGHLNCLQYAHENKCPWDKEVCSSAASYGHLNTLQYAHENGCPWDEETCYNAAYDGHLNCLQYAHEKGCPWDEKTCLYAAYDGHLDCLQYAHEGGCPWDEWTCSNAASNGHLNCLKYAHENGCPWDKETLLEAAENGHIECVQYARAHACPREDEDKDTFIIDSETIPIVQSSIDASATLNDGINSTSMSDQNALDLDPSTVLSKTIAELSIQSITSKDPSAELRELASNL